MSPSVTVRLIDVFLIVIGQQWNSIAQTNKIYQGFDTYTILTILVFLWDLFTIGNLYQTSALSLEGQKLWAYCCRPDRPCWCPLEAIIPEVEQSLYCHHPLWGGSFSPEGKNSYMWRYVELRYNVNTGTHFQSAHFNLSGFTEPNIDRPGEGRGRGK